MIVANIGGFSMDKNIPSEELESYYERFADSMSKIDFEGVELIPQNMAPFPWHFGGQSHHNLFVDPDEINDFCMENNAKICYDVSHSMMACNYYCWPLSSFTPKILPDGVVRFPNSI